jgi:FemAB-related protein (PEP-CTERM system-associated)
VENEEEGGGHRLSGILPLVHIKSLLFGNSLVSMPFLNYGGLLADDEKTEKMLLEEARRLGRELRTNKIELRHIHPISWANGQGPESAHEPEILKPMTHKTRMVLDLPESSAKLFESFKSKLRSQIRNPQKRGLVAHIGGAEFLSDYYHVFSVNMRDLGSPVHSKRLFEHILKEFSANVRLGVVKYNEAPAAVGLIFCFRELVEIIWASSLKSLNHLSPNMLLYWSFLKYVTDAGYRQFDFGRSTLDEGTYKFKEQWGAKPQPLYWYYYSSLNKSKIKRMLDPKNDSFLSKAVALWSNFPVWIANIIGPKIRKSLSL